MENYGGKVRDGVGVGGGHHEHEAENPNLAVEGTCQIFFENEWHGFGVGSVAFDSFDNKCCLLFLEESAPDRILWEINEEPV
jgi:hypothetical protein